LAIPSGDTGWGSDTFQARRRVSLQTARL